MSSSVPSGRTAAITAAVAVAGALLMYKLRRPANSDASATATAPAADAVAPPPSPSKASSSGASAAEVDATNGPESQLEFCLNGAVQRLGGTGQAPVDPSISLNDYIRRFTPFKGTKLACGEGGCGACAVMLTRVEPSTGEVVHKSVNSCLCPLASLDGWAVTTTEGLGGSTHPDGFHPIHERIAGFNGSQCGFCTPGMVMTLYSALKAAEQRGDDIMGLDIESLFDGNLCRCTGYRPILDAARSFGDSTDIEDLVCGTTRTGMYNTERDPTTPELVRIHKPRALRFSGGGLSWYKVTSLQQAHDALASVVAAGQVPRIVVANTSSGIYKHEPFDVIIDVRDIPELQGLKIKDGSVTVGAAVSISDVIRLAETEETMQPIHTALQRIANVHVRNAGSLGGNLMLAKNKGFLSDAATMLVAARATVSVCSAASGSKTLSLYDFVRGPPLASTEILTAIHIPLRRPDDNQLVFFKAALRPVNSHAFVNAGIRVEVGAGNMVTDAILAFGGVGDKVVRATDAEAVFVGRQLGRPAFEACIEAASATLTFNDAPRKAYRKQLVSGFILKAAVHFAGHVDTFGGDFEAKPAAGESAGAGAGAGVGAGAGTGAATSQDTFGHEYAETQRPVRRARIIGKQKFDFSDAQAPVSKPIPKLSAKLQASGEAVFVDDVPERSDTLYGAYVLSTKAKATVDAVDTSAALALDGVVAFITKDDIPGENNGTFSSPSKETLFADGYVNFVGQVIGMIVATKPWVAQRGARLVVVDYGDRPGETRAHITLEDVHADGPAAVKAANKGGPRYKRGDAEATLEAAAAGKVPNTSVIDGTVYCKTQKHFYMEPQTSYAIPDEDGTMRVFASMQNPGGVNAAVSRVLGLPLNKVQVVARRTGGGFGGKLTRHTPHAAAAAVAAHALRRPVRVTLSRNDDMKTTGGREDVLAKYQVAFDATGKLVAVQVSAQLNGGYDADISGFATWAFTHSVDQAYYAPHFDTSGEYLHTNTLTRTAARGPGDAQSAYVMETILDHVASASGVPPHVVRERNFYPKDRPELLVSPSGSPISNLSVHRLWKRLKERANYEEQLAQVREFNRTHKNKKRGISMTTTKYGVQASFMGALVNVYSDASIMITHGGCEIGQGIHTKVAQVASHELGKLLGRPVPMGAIRFSDTNSHIVPNMGMTGGSTTSESSCEAVRLACAQLVERLQPALAQLKEEEESKAASGTSKGSQPIGFDDVIKRAGRMKIDLSSQASMRRVGDSPLAYNIFGAACSVVEVDALTGETSIIRTDIVYDCGKSLNPAIDIGQCEGAFVMGIGFFLREDELLHKDGTLESDGTWEYKPPCYQDIPQAFNVEFIENEGNPGGILSSKASGEPPLCLAASVMLAVRNAITAARADKGITGWFRMDTPATVEQVQLLCAGVEGAGVRSAVV